MKKHKLILGLLCTASIVGGSLSLAGCGHAHTYSEEWTKTATKHYYSADCGHDEKLAEGNHVYGEPVITKSATETEEGLKTKSCLVCAYSVTEAIPATGHTYSDKWTTTPEKHYREATCGHEAVYGEAEHAFGDWTEIVSATHAQDGVSARYCGVCGYADVKSVSDDSEHTYDIKWSFDGANHWISSTCGHSEIKDKAPHNFVVDEKISAKLIDLGYHLKACSNCNYKVFEAHSPNQTQTLQELTCEQDGIKKYTCLCGYEWESTTKATHRFDNFLLGKNETHHWKPLVCEHKDLAEAEQMTIIQNSAQISGYDEHDFTKQISADKTEMSLTCKGCNYHTTKPVTGVVDYDFKVYSKIGNNGKPSGSCVTLDGDEIRIINNNTMYFMFANEQPEGSSIGDESIKVYEVDGEGNEIPLSTTSTGVLYFSELTADPSIALKVTDGNNHKIKVVTNYAEKVFTLVPNVVDKMTTEYSLDNGATWTTAGSAITVSAGQSIWFTTNYDGCSISSLLNMNDFSSTGADISAGAPQEGKNNIIVFTPTQSGNFMVTISYFTKSSNITITVS